jgi:hypothetical protein
MAGPLRGWVTVELSIWVCLKRLSGIRGGCWERSGAVCKIETLGYFSICNNTSATSLARMNQQSSLQR